MDYQIVMSYTVAGGGRRLVVKRWIIAVVAVGGRSYSTALLAGMVGVVKENIRSLTRQYWLPRKPGLKTKLKR